MKSSRANKNKLAMEVKCVVNERFDFMEVLSMKILKISQAYSIFNLVKGKWIFEVVLPQPVGGHRTVQRFARRRPA